MEDALGRLMLNEKFYKASEIREQAEKFSEEQFQKNFKKIVTQVIS